MNTTFTVSYAIPNANLKDAVEALGIGYDSTATDLQAECKEKLRQYFEQDALTRGEALAGQIADHARNQAYQTASESIKSGISVDVQ